MLTIRRRRLRSHRDYTATTPGNGTSCRFAAAQRSRSLSERSGHARRAASTRAAVDDPSGDGQRSPPGAHRTNMRNPGSSPTTVIGRGVLQSKHAAGTQSPRLAVGGGDGKGPLQNDAELNCGSRMVEAFFEVLSTPARVKSSEECARGRKIASDVDWRRSEERR